MQSFENCKKIKQYFTTWSGQDIFKIITKKKIYSILDNLDQSENLSVSFALALILLIDTFSR